MEVGTVLTNLLQRIARTTTIGFIWTLIKKWKYKRTKVDFQSMVHLISSHPPIILIRVEAKKSRWAIQMNQKNSHISIGQTWLHNSMISASYKITMEDMEIPTTKEVAELILMMKIYPTIFKIKTVKRWYKDPQVLVRSQHTWGKKKTLERIIC